MTHDIVAELDGIDLGDRRLNKRAKRVLSALAAQPEASINGACGAWDETMGAYRLLHNQAVTVEGILEPHRRATLARIAQHPVVLIVQDTTEIDFTAHPAKDSLHLESEHRLGLYDHCHVAFTPDGLCLGVLRADFYARTAASLGQTQSRKRDPIETKESYRWLLGGRLANTVAQEQPATHIISVADAEADIYDIFVELFNDASHADFIIRAKQVRLTTEKAEPAGETYRQVRDSVAASPLQAIREIDLPTTPKRAQRRARLEIRAQALEVRPPVARQKLGTVRYNAVLVEEVGRPSDDPTRVLWLLITTLPIETVEQVLAVVDFYVGRWPIEPFFRVYKTGCRVEAMQLETSAARERCLAFYKIVAWHIIYLKQLARHAPEQPCDQVFHAQQWQTVWRIVRREPPPAQAPPLRQFVRVLAQLGGYNNRKTEPDPGPQCLWVALRRLLDFTLARNAFVAENADVYK